MYVIDNRLSDALRGWQQGEPMICGHCQTPNPDQSAFCSGCGASLSDADNAATIDRLETVSLPIGEDFGPRYQVESVLGVGGMGKVYKAHDRELDRTVALKILRQDVVADPMALQRFKQELKLASRISHPNILRIHDLGECRGMKFISMQYVEGGDLLQLLQREGPLSVSRAVPIMVQLCEALQAAQSANVIHRDLKPQNILLGEGDHIFVSDFGLAKSIEASMAGVTRDGAILGTPKYMSPEQVQGKPVDQRADIYSLGLIFYEILAGKLPFTGNSTYELMYQRVHELPRRPEEFNSQIPAYLSAIVLRCLERDPDLRYQSGAEILADLRASEASSPALSQQVTSIIRAQSPRRAFLTGGIGLGVVLLVVLAFYLQRQFAKPHDASVAGGGGAAVSSGPRKSVLLLPLQRAQEQGDLASQADGIIDSLSGRLSQFGSLQIETLPSDNSGEPRDSPQELARQFGTQMYLTGSFNEVAGKLHAHLNLQDTASGKTVWSRDFSAVPQDLFSMQDEIYNKVLAGLNVKPTADELALGAARPTENIDAYGLYLRGRSAIRNQRSEQTLHSAIDLYNEALKKDASFGLAYSGLADADLDLYRLTKDSTLPEKALGAALQAEQIEPNKPEVHFSLGSVYMATGKNAEAVAEFKSALKLAPNSDEGYRRLGSAWRAAGHKDEALAAYQHSVDLNQYYWLNYEMLGSAALAFGENEKALAAYQRVTQLVPKRADGYNGLGVVYFQLSQWAQCIPAFEKAMAIEPGAETSSNLGTAYYYLHRYDDAIKAYQEAAKLAPRSQTIAGNLADALRAAGQADAARAAYDRAITLALEDYRVNSRNADTVASLALYYAKKGDTTQALEFIHRARTLEPDAVEYLDDEAIVNALANRPKQALDAVRAALAKGYSAEELKNEPELRSLQSLPEFQRLVSGANTKKN
jgi:serine/threonine protein kinase/tetratricopeptide (TPR) repeat protein